MAESLGSTEERDINDMFDSIVMLEQKVAADGFREGFEKGQQEGTEEGYRLGHRHGLSIGSELGFYRGAATTWLEVATKFEGQVSDKAVAALNKVIELLDKFPTTITQDMDINEEIDKVKAAYRKACSLLKIEPSAPVMTKLTF
ncbi:hypothetical protein B566_EDAN005126 [Ephemera danica]|nr:hypothetical protein B566_EDAN005126 [Ephemera danica]